MSNTDKLLYIDGLGEITQNLNIGGNINLTETLFTKKLGIGTNNPQYDLDINGTLGITGTLSTPTIRPTNFAQNTWNPVIKLTEANANNIAFHIATHYALDTEKHYWGLLNNTNSNALIHVSQDGNIVIQGDLRVTNTLTVDSATTLRTLDISHTTESTSKDTGALIVNGGIGIAKNLNIGGNLNIDTIREYTTNAGVTIHNPIIKGASNDENRIIIKDKNLSNNMYILVPDITSDINLTLPSQGGTLALLSDISSSGGSSVWSQSNTTISYGSGSVKINLSYSNYSGISFNMNNHSHPLHIGLTRSISTPDEVYYRTIVIQPPYHTGGPWIQWVHDVSSAAWMGWSYGSNICLEVSSGQAVRGRTNYQNVSDDRIKIDEELIVNSIDTLLKLKPQKYKKIININKISDLQDIDNSEYVSIIESGLIAQEIYYDAPELRHLVHIPEDATLINDNNYDNFDDIKNDPDYNNWGDDFASVSYTEFIPYLIKGIQEQQEQINTLKQENIELKSIVDKLKTANSFEEFKNSL